MIFGRLATIELSRPAPDHIGNEPYRASNGIEVRQLPPPTNKPTPTGSTAAAPGLKLAWAKEATRLLIAVEARSEISNVGLDEQGFIRVPAEPRESCEAALQEYGDFLGVMCHCARTLRSPKPCVYFCPTEVEIAAGIWPKAEHVAGPPVGGARITPIREPWPDLELAPLLEDRPDGLALLSDALAASDGIGKAHEYFRLFERAFKCGPSDCARYLGEFLASGWVELGYAKSEVDGWFNQLRHLVTHADRRPGFARHRDIGSIVERMDYAAYDVLLNKTIWRDPSPTRRQGYTLAGGVDSDRKTVVLHGRGIGATLSTVWSDPFDVFPVDHDATISVGPPAVSSMPGYTSEDPTEDFTSAGFRTTAE